MAATTATPTSRRDARILIDPGHVSLFPHVESGLREAGLNIADIDLVICTHAHPDHIEAVRLLKDTEALFALHEGDWQLSGEMGRSLGTFFEHGGYTPSFFLTSGELIVKDLQLEVIHTPAIPRDRFPLLPQAQSPLHGGCSSSKTARSNRPPRRQWRYPQEEHRELAFFDAEWFFPATESSLKGEER